MDIHIWCPPLPSRELIKPDALGKELVGEHTIYVLLLLPLSNRSSRNDWGSSSPSHPSINLGMNGAWMAPVVLALEI